MSIITFIKYVLVNIKVLKRLALYTYKYTVSEVRIGDCGLSEHMTERETFAAQGQRSKHIMSAVLAPARCKSTMQN